MRVQTKEFSFNLNGLLPNVIYTITIDGNDWSALTKQSGKDYGSSLISDTNGNLLIRFLYESMFANQLNVELPLRSNGKISSQSKKHTRTLNSKTSVELSDITGLSKVQFFINKNIHLSPGPDDGHQMMY